MLTLDDYHAQRETLLKAKQATQTDLDRAALRASDDPGQLGSVETLRGELAHIETQLSTLEAAWRETQRERARHASADVRKRRETAVAACRERSEELLNALAEVEAGILHLETWLPKVWAAENAARDAVLPLMSRAQPNRRMELLQTHLVHADGIRTQVRGVFPLPHETRPRPYDFVRDAEAKVKRFLGDARRILGVGAPETVTSAEPAGV